MAAQGTDSLFWTKVVGAVLSAGILGMGTGFIAELLVHPKHLEENAYKVEVTEVAATSGAEEPAGPEPIVGLLASADPAAGEKLSKKCAACHSFDNGGPNKVGPNLWGVVGRAVASHEGFGYSAAMKEHGGNWGYAELNEFLFKPKAYVSGTKMNFAGFKKAEERANMIAWLRSLSDSPQPLPE